MNDEASAAEEEARGAGCPVVGIGASAGGIDALLHMLPNISAESGMSFVVVMHLDPEHKSILDQILGRRCALKVTQIEHGVPIEPNHVHVIPPKAVLTIRDGRLLLSDPAVPRGLFHPIDEFFASLAVDQAENAACIILSGTGSDGTIGLRAIKEHGGLALAQDGAEYTGMMRSAVATGLVDLVLRAEEMPAHLADYFAHVTRARGQGGPGVAQMEAVRQLDQITTLLRTKIGHDFGRYKDRTIVRRVQRRMHVLQIDDVPTFIARLREDNREAELLFQDLLIGVTNFFRDPEAFAALERDVIPRLFSGKGPDDAVRVWVPGCSTGEEAYSIAMLLRDAAPQHNPPRLQVFASDIDERALETARVGRYPISVAKEISDARVERYLVREEGTYRISAELREICLFSSHNLLQDAPFSRLDLVSCRNVLIYLGSDLQDRVIPLFHYALNQNAYLFLGTSENVTRHTRLFSTIDKTFRLFRRRGHLERRIPEFPLAAPMMGRRQALAPSRSLVNEGGLKAAAERQLLDRFAPAYVVVNAEGDVVQSSGRTGKYLELPAGTPDNNILSMARSGLRLDLRAALHRAVASGQVVVQNRISIGTNGGRQELDLFVQPLRLPPPLDQLYMVVFKDVGTAKPEAEHGALTGDEDVEAVSVRELESDLRATRERLQSTTEELESSNEELKSSNEELQSINEELQSTNEELETSKEELQSINEELQTVNSELNVRVEELSRANNDMSNLLESTQIATVFLDRSLVIRRFTPAARDVFHLVESDTGRPIMHVRPRFELDALQGDAERVLRTLATIEKPVRGADGETRFVMRMLPYRTADNVIAGVVMTFTDITRIAAAEARIEQLAGDLRMRISELETLLDLLPVGVMVAENEAASSILINTYGGRLLGGDNGHRGFKTVRMNFRLFDGDGELAGSRHPLQLAARTGTAVPGWQGRLEDHTGNSVNVMISATPLFTEMGGVRGAIAAIVDMTVHKRAEARQLMLLNELQHRVKNILATVNALAIRMSRGGMSVEAFHAALLSRLAAMGRVHNLLTNSAWSGAGVQELIQASLDPYNNTDSDGSGRIGAGNVMLTGADIRLSANSATTLGMVFHELATNASKYGALSTTAGQVQVSWRVMDKTATAGTSLRLVWTERGGPAVAASPPSGFGTGFLVRSVEYELGGSATLDFAQQGLVCTIDFPLAGNVERLDHEGE